MGFRPDATELGDARRRVEALVGTEGQRPFHEPWELRAFAVAVAAYHAGQYEWSEFQLSLVDSIRRWEDGDGGEPWSYYTHWLEALETVLSGNGVLSDAALDDRMRDVLASPPNKDHHEAHRDPVAVDPAR